MNPQVVDQLLRSGDVTSGRPEALGEGSHHNVDVTGVEAEVVDEATTSRADGSDLCPNKDENPGGYFKLIMSIIYCRIPLTEMSRSE